MLNAQAMRSDRFGCPFAELTAVAFLEARNRHSFLAQPVFLITEVLKFSISLTLDGADISLRPVHKSAIHQNLDLSVVCRKLHRIVRLIFAQYVRVFFGCSQSALPTTAESNLAIRRFLPSRHASEHVFNASALIRGCGISELVAISWLQLKSPARLQPNAGCTGAFVLLRKIFAVRGDSKLLLIPPESAVQLRDFYLAITVVSSLAAACPEEVLILMGSTLLQLMILHTREQSPSYPCKVLFIHLCAEMACRCPALWMVFDSRYSNLSEELKVWCERVRSNRTKCVPFFEQAREPIGRSKCARSLSEEILTFFQGKETLGNHKSFVRELNLNWLWEEHNSKRHRMNCFQLHVELKLNCKFIGHRLRAVWKAAAAAIIWWRGRVRGQIRRQLFSTPALK